MSDNTDRKRGGVSRMDEEKELKRHRSAEEQVEEEEEEAEESEEEGDASEDDEKSKVATIIVQFQTPDGQMTGSQLELPMDINTAQMQELINELLSNEEKHPYSFFINDEEILESLKETIAKHKTSTETVVPIVYQPQAIFRVRAVTRCTSTLPGHAEAVLHVSFSPNGQKLASGSGDGTVRLWDVNTETPTHTLKGHTNWVLAVAWSPNGKYLASGSMDGDVRIWTEDGQSKGKPLKAHKKWITSLAWEPLHLNGQSTRVASASKDGTIRIWDIVRGQCTMTLSGHAQAVKCLKWGGSGLLYSGSQDRTIKVWETEKGRLVRSLDGHAHWVNTLSLNSDDALRRGCYDHKGKGPTEEKEMMAAAKEKYEKAIATSGGRELLVSGSDDFTCYLWEPTVGKKPILRMTGHQQPVNYVMFSPDGRYIASASFDKSVKLWHGASGKFLANFRAHVGAVYQVAWSADSRLLVSSSKDSTMKVWEVRTKKMKFDLPGHADEVYAVDWSPDGERVASGGKDKVLKIWRQ